MPLNSPPAKGIQFPSCFQQILNADFNTHDKEYSLATARTGGFTDMILILGFRQLQILVSI
jgi:hypothetical protein